MTIRALVFNMDGTILHSLPDLAICVNGALERMGYPTRTYDEIESFMGAGCKELIDQAVPAGTAPEQCAETLELWRSLYLASDYVNTAPFPGIVDMLHDLRDRGIKTAILSNKFDAGVRVLADRCFPGLFDIVQGEIPPLPRKPDPASLLNMLDELGVGSPEAAYVGDTGVDVLTARNAGVRAIGVSWGYAKAAPLCKEHLDAFIHDPAELLALV